MIGWGVEEQGWRKGPWTAEEDKLLSEYVSSHGEGSWSSVARSAGLNRSGKSSRLRWVNYLKPGLKRGQLTPQEEGIIIELHALWGNKWSTIARYLPGRTDNEIKNYWRTHFKKKEISSKKQEKRKTRLLMPKQQPQQQQQEQQQQQYHHQHKQDDGTKMAPFHTEAEFNTIAMNEPQGIQQKSALYTYAALEDHQCWNVMHQLDTTASWSDPMGDDVLWDGGLWNLDDEFHGCHNSSSTSGCCNIGRQIQADHTSSHGGVGDTNSTGGYIFK